ncbi:DNA polymerase III, clamp loader complex, gamma/delta/delta subunit [Coemansia spiralis]|nr:DNA polymerase III, clamp loader complex, gamma/delta/delta subunit [Coemansia spiralis]
MNNNSSSSLVACPICTKQVPEWYMNDHLDRECNIMQVNSQDSNICSINNNPDTNTVGPFQKTPTKRAAFALSNSSKAVGKETTAMFPFSKKARPESNTNILSVSSTSLAEAQQSIAPQPSQPRLDSSESNDPEKRLRNKHLPLAERLRPLTLDSFVGQLSLVGPQGILRSLIERDQIVSMIFWGSPGLGKTTLARIIARQTKSAFKEMSAVTQNTADVKKAIEEAGNLNRLAHKRTIVFLDEIHRFNKAQQDIFLPYLERGQIVLIGATTENPSFKLNGALLSRCRVFKLEPLSDSDIAQIAILAAKVKQNDLGVEDTGIDQDIASYIASVSNGDARVAINIIDIAMNALSNGRYLDLDCVKQALQRTHVVYGAEEHYDLISALHKSVRGSDDNAALYWLGRMLQGGDDPLYIARRLIRMASEDIGLADNNALGLAVSTLHACQAIGMPECDTILAHCVVYLARAPKSVESYKAFNKVKAVVEAEHPWPVPLHLRNAPTPLMKEMGYAKGYKYNPDYNGSVEQDYMPVNIKHCNFFDDDTR